MMKQIILSVWGVLGFSFAFAQSADFEKVMGEWTGTGKLFGQEASFSMIWELTLNDQFIHLTFQNQLTANGKNNVMNAQAYYKPSSDNTFIGTWFDSRGMILPLNAIFKDNMLTTEWGSVETEKGKTTYEIKSKNVIEVKDYVFTNEQWQQFGYATYQRK
ncbi:MAG: hypothetical protein IPJ74_18610 [Saprospiraceae bacterium]|nr:hypothetical protein [Saprospiraceae bacterium]